MPTVFVYWSPSRTSGQKKAVAKHIIEALVTEGGARREDVLVIFQNIEPGDSIRGTPTDIVFDGSDGSQEDSEKD